MNKIVLFLLITGTSYSFCSWYQKQEQEKIDLALKNHKALMIAIENGDLEQIQSIAKEDAYINYALPPDSKVPLTTAVNLGCIDVVKLLLEIGVHVDPIDLGGNSPLLAAIDNNYNEIAKLLLDNNANVNIKDIEGNTSLTYVRDDYMTDLLLEYHANPNIVNKKGQNAISSYIQRVIDMQNVTEDEEISLYTIEAMLEKGAKIDNQDILGNTALFYASDRFLSTVELLLEYGAAFNIHNKEGKTALDHAFKHYFNYIIERNIHLVKNQKNIIFILLNKYYESYLNYSPKLAKTINKALPQLPADLANLVYEYKNSFFDYLEVQLGKPLPESYLPIINKFLDTKQKRKSNRPSSQITKRRKTEDLL